MMISLDGPADAWRAFGVMYRLVYDTVSSRVVRVYTDEPLPPACFRVIAVLGVSALDESGHLRPSFWSLPRWHHQPHARFQGSKYDLLRRAAKAPDYVSILRGDPASPIGAGRGTTER